MDNPWFGVKEKIRKALGVEVVVIMSDRQQKVYTDVVRNNEVLFGTWHPYKALRNSDNPEFVREIINTKADEIRDQLLEGVDWYSYFDETQQTWSLFDDLIMTQEEFRSAYGLDGPSTRSDSESL